MPPTDATLLDRWISRRDAEAFNELVSRYADLVYNVSERILRNRADAEDVSQNCFLKLASTTSVPCSSLVSWLHAVATRGAVDCLRGRARRRRRERRFAENQAKNPSSEPSWEELQEHVDACIATLPDDIRRVIVAHFLQRKTHEEIATEIGVSRQTVTYRVRKGIERIRTLLRKRGMVVSGAVLATLLGASAVEAAPGALLASLGRLALSGSTVSETVASSATLPLIGKVGGSIMTKKLLISTVAAVAILLTGFVAIQSPLDTDDRETATRGSVLPSGATETGTGREREVARSPGGRESRGRQPIDGASSMAEPRIAFAGTVLDTGGQPVTGATVVAASGSSEKLEKLSETVSDSRGRFGLDVAGDVEVVVFAFKSAIGLGAVTGRPTGVEVVLDPLCEVSGRIYDRDTGRAIVGLSVRLSRFDTPGVSRDLALYHFEAWSLFPTLHGETSAVVTDRDGFYVFRDVSPLRYGFEFDAKRSQYVLPGFRGGESPRVIQLDPGEQRANVDFALQRGGSITGTVLDPEDQPIPQAHVELLNSFKSPMRRTLRCDANGAYRFNGLVPNATYVTHAWHEGFAPAESQPVPMAVAENFHQVDVGLTSGHALHGRFIDDVETPIGEIEVYLSKRFEPRNIESGYGKTVTREDGSFSFAHIGPGEHVLHPLSKEHRTDELFTFTMPADRDLTDEEFVLRRKATGFISGRVVDSSGDPVARVTVRAFNKAKNISEKTLSGENGKFRVDGLGSAESFALTAYSSDYWSQRREGIPLYSTDVTLLMSQYGRIRGHVIDEETGAPVEHFEIRTVSRRTLANGRSNRFHSKWKQFDSTTGEFQIERAEPIANEIQARADGYVANRSPLFDVPAGGTADGIEIRLRRGGAVLGTVVNAETGEPIEGAHVRAHQHDSFQPWLLEVDKKSYTKRGIWKRTMSGQDGRFALNGLKPDAVFHLAVWKEGYGTVVLPGVSAAKSDRELKVLMAVEATLLLDARFRPLPDGRFTFVAHHREKKPWRTAFYAYARVDRPGKVKMDGLPPGRFRLAVYWTEKSHGDEAYQLVGERQIRLVPGERRELALDVDDLGRQFGSVAGKVGGVVDTTQVFLSLVGADGAGEHYSFRPVQCDADGRFHFTGLPPGKYVIQAKYYGAEPAAEVQLPVRVQARAHREIEVNFQ